jgi:hypothetical protein
VRHTGGFSFIELLVALFVGTLVFVIGIKATKRFQNSVNRSQQERALMLEALSVMQRVQLDLQNAVWLSGQTAETTFLENARTYGVLRYPFQSPVDLHDGIQIFLMNEDLSTSSYCPVVSITNDLALNRSVIVVSGDLRSTVSFPVNTSDYFVISSGTVNEAFAVTGNIVYNSVSDRSTFTVTNTVPVSLTATLGTASNPFVYRIQKIIYKVGHGSSQTGLYRGTEGLNGSFTSLTDHLDQLLISYSLQPLIGETNNADCQAKSGERWFAHNLNTNECNWNDVTAIHLKFLFTLDFRGETIEQNMNISVTPANYTR